MNEKQIVKGYYFATIADADLAREEVETIEYLDANMNYANIAKVAQLYDKAYDSKMFKTPAGWEYLVKLRNILLSNGYLEEELRPITVNSMFVRSSVGDSLAERIRPSKRREDPYKKRFSFALAIIVALVIAIIGMFVIALTSDTPNMINYRDAIVNEYASWEQDISDREDAVREKERELGMVSPLPHEVGVN